MAGLAGVRQRLVQASVAGTWSTFLGVGGGLAALGAVLVFLNLSGENAGRVWTLFHVNWIYFTGLAGGSAALVAAHKTVHAKWSGVIVRFAAASAAFLPLSLVGLVLMFTVGYDHVYGHMHEELHSLSHGKALWLGKPFMFGRLFVGLSLLCWLAYKLIRTDVIPDMYEARGAVAGGRKAMFESWSDGFDGSEGAHERTETALRMWGPLYVVTYALVFTMIAFDGMMALQPHWFSNLFGGWYFMGSFLGAHMLLNLMQMHNGAHLGINDLITDKQRHDLGKLCFGFTIFWTYLMWAQFQVIWYANLPEETGFVFSRLYGDWWPVGRAVFLGMFVVPFFGFLGVLPKQTRWWATVIASVSLTALFTERFLMIVPSVSYDAGPRFGLPEIGATALVAGLFLLAYALFARTFPMVSPRLAMTALEKEHAHSVPPLEGAHH